MSEQFTQKWTVVQLLEDVPEDLEYTEQTWPLHMTLADVFSIDWKNGALDGLTKLLSQQNSVETHALDDIFLGPTNNPVKVTRLENSPILQDLHVKIINLLIDYGAEFNNPEYTKQGFIPHTTVQRHARLKRNESVRINQLTIVDMYPGNDAALRKLGKKMLLGD